MPIEVILPILNYVADPGTCIQDDLSPIEEDVVTTPDLIASIIDCQT